MVEEDGDEVFIPMHQVQCCRIGFEGDKPIYSKLIAVRRGSSVFMCCDTCGGSYGAASADASLIHTDVDLHRMVQTASRARQAPHVYNLK